MDQSEKQEQLLLAHRKAGTSQRHSFDLSDLEGSPATHVVTVLLDPPDLEPQFCFTPSGCAEKQLSSFRSEDEKVLRCPPPD
jgi:hypothetical protein